mmetsp:Transcript_36492/g.101291  ORF Transcript_36492/g.101291 Transcript_36492/m.101291 type:complete len:307 (+) Transcript_36492:683-1603(+)
MHSSTSAFWLLLLRSVGSRDNQSLMQPGATEPAGAAPEASDATGGADPAATDVVPTAAATDECTARPGPFALWLAASVFSILADSAFMDSTFEASAFTADGGGKTGPDEGITYPLALPGQAIARTCPDFKDTEGPDAFVEGGLNHRLAFNGSMDTPPCRSFSAMEAQVCGSSLSSVITSSSAPPSLPGTSASAASGTTASSSASGGSPESSSSATSSSVSAPSKVSSATGSRGSAKALSSKPSATSETPLDCCTGGCVGGWIGAISRCCCCCCCCCGGNVPCGSICCHECCCDTSAWTCIRGCWCG